VHVRFHVLSKRRIRSVRIGFYTHDRRNGIHTQRHPSDGDILHLGIAEHIYAGGVEEQAQLVFAAVHGVAYVKRGRVVQTAHGADGFSVDRNAARAEHVLKCQEKPCRTPRIAHRKDGAKRTAPRRVLFRTQQLLQKVHK